MLIQDEMMTQYKTLLQQKDSQLAHFNSEIHELNDEMSRLKIDLTSKQTEIEFLRRQSLAPTPKPRQPTKEHQLRETAEQRNRELKKESEEAKQKCIKLQAELQKSISERDSVSGFASTIQLYLWLN